MTDAVVISDNVSSTSREAAKNPPREIEIDPKDGK